MVAFIAKYAHGYWKEINDRVGMEKVCMDENRARFLQATQAYTTIT